MPFPYKFPFRFEDFTWSILFPEFADIEDTIMFTDVTV